MVSTPVPHLPTDASMWRVLPARGALDESTIPGLRDELLSAIADGQRWHVLDLTDVTEVSDDALSMLTSVQRRLHALDGCLRLVVQAAPVLAVLRTSGLDRLLQVFESVEAARLIPAQR